MLKALLIACLFFGLITMILMEDRRSEWIYLLLLSVLVFSVGSGLIGTDFALPDREEFLPDQESFLPESEALASAVSDEVLMLTGERPVSVRSDLRRDEDSYSLTRIRVVIRTGDETEVQNALQKSFSFEGFTVVREEADGPGGSFGVLP